MLTVKISETGMLIGYAPKKYMLLGGILQIFMADMPLNSPPIEYLLSDLDIIILDGIELYRKEGYENGR